MSKKKSLVEDQPAAESEQIVIKDEAIPSQEASTNAATEPLPGEQDPTRNPDTVEGSVFHQVPAEQEGKSEESAEDAPQLKTEEEPAGYEDYSPTADEIVQALDKLLGVFFGQEKVALMQRVEHLFKEHKARM
jgi:hypothetical protein